MKCYSRVDGVSVYFFIFKNVEGCLVDNGVKSLVFE